MKTFTFRWPEDDFSTVYTDVLDVREQSDPWLDEELGVELVAVKVDFANGMTKQLKQIRTGYTLI